MKSSGGKRAAAPPLENRLLRARARGEVSADEAFEALFREYARLVAGWLSVRVDASQVDDLAQDVWLIFYARFRRWEFGTEMESEEARPVLSFLFRCCQLVARSHRRIAQSRRSEPLLENDERIAYDGRRALARDVEARKTLELARRICPEEELDVLLAKLSGLSAKDIANMLSITPAVVDHRYRDALDRIRQEMRLDRPKRGSRKKAHG